MMQKNPEEEPAIEPQKVSVMVGDDVDEAYNFKNKSPARPKERSVQPVVKRDQGRTTGTQFLNSKNQSSYF